MNFKGSAIEIIERHFGYCKYSLDILSYLLCTDEEMLSKYCIVKEILGFESFQFYESLDTLARWELVRYVCSDTYILSQKGRRFLQKLPQLDILFTLTNNEQLLDRMPSYNLNFFLDQLSFNKVELSLLLAHDCTIIREFASKCIKQQ